MASISAEQQRVERSTQAASWAQVVMLVVTVICMIFGGVVVNEVRAGRSDAGASAADRQASDHETRIRRLEESQIRVEGKLDRLGDRLDNIAKMLGHK